MHNVDDIVIEIGDIIDRAFTHGALSSVKSVVLPQEFNKPGNYIEIFTTSGALWRIDFTQIEDPRGE